MNSIAKDFLIEQLNSLSVMFPDVCIKYEHRKNTNSHIIEVKPVSVFENNEDYIRAEINLEESFEKKFPNEDLIFISENSLTKINDPEYTFGDNFMSFDVSIIETDNISSDMDEIFGDNSISWALAA